MRDPILDLLLKRLDELQKSALEYAAQDYPSSRELVGRYNELKSIIQEVTTMLEEDDN
jgi:hypothetical protein